MRRDLPVLVFAPDYQWACYWARARRLGPRDWLMVRGWSDVLGRRGNAYVFLAGDGRYSAFIPPSYLLAHGFVRYEEPS